MLTALELLVEFHLAIVFKNLDIFMCSLHLFIYFLGLNIKIILLFDYTKSAFVFSRWYIVD